MKQSSRKIKKIVVAGALAVTTLLTAGVGKISAADVKSDSYYVYYQNMGNYQRTEYCKTTLYTGTNYFSCSSITGESDYIAVSCTGDNVVLDKTLKSTQVKTISFRPELKAGATNRKEAVYKVVLDNNNKDTSAYVKGKIYYN